MGMDCKYCGAYVAGSADKCPACGKRINYKAESSKAYASVEPEVEVKAEPKTEAKTEAKTEQKAYTYKEEYEKRYGASAAPAAKAKTQYSSAKDAEDADVKANQLISFLCYFGPLFLIPYLLKPESDFVKFHSNQGLLLLIASIVFEVAAGIIPFLGWIIGLLGGLFVFACFLKGLINVYHGVKAELPYIGSFKLLK